MTVRDQILHEIKRHELPAFQYSKRVYSAKDVCTRLGLTEGQAYRLIGERQRSSAVTYLTGDDYIRLVNAAGRLRDF